MAVSSVLDPSAANASMQAQIAKQDPNTQISKNLASIASGAISAYSGYKLGKAGLAKLNSNSGTIQSPTKGSGSVAGVGNGKPTQPKTYTSQTFENGGTQTYTNTIHNNGASFQSYTDTANPSANYTKAYDPNGLTMKDGKVDMSAYTSDVPTEGGTLSNTSSNGTSGSATSGNGTASGSSTGTQAADASQQAAGSSGSGSSGFGTAELGAGLAILGTALNVWDTVQQQKAFDESVREMNKQLSFAVQNTNNQVTTTNNRINSAVNIRSAMQNKTKEQASAALQSAKEKNVKKLDNMSV